MPVLLSVIAAILLAGLVLAAVARFAPQDGGGPGAGPTGGQPADPAPVLKLDDPLRGPRLWEAVTVPAEKASCYFDDALIAEREESTGTLRCRGPKDDLPADQRVQVDIRLLTAGSCASFWLRFADNKGYQVRVCADRVMVGSHVTAHPAVYKTIPFDDPIEVGAREPTTIAVTASGDTIEVTRDGDPVGGPVTLPDEGIGTGRIVLGIFTEEPGPGHAPPYRVAYTDVKIWSLAG